MPCRGIKRDKPGARYPHDSKKCNATGSSIWFAIQGIKRYNDDAMFVRTKVFKNKDGSERVYLQVVESIRAEGRIQQRVIANLGRLEELQEGKLDRLIEGLTRYSKAQWVKLQADAQGLGVKWSKEWGPALIFRRLWEQLGLAEILDKLQDRTLIERDVQEVAFAMALNRLVEQHSKLGVNRWVERVYRPEFESLELHHYYRALDFLAEHKDEIELRLFDRVRDLFHLELDLVFWDSTSTYLEGSKGPGGLAKHGYSKDKWPDHLQVMVGLLLTRDGFPVAHQIFPGNMADVDTFRAALRDVRERFKLGRVILVGDRGRVSAEVLAEIERAGLQYIVGVKLRRLRSMAAVLSRAGRYQVVKENLQVKQVNHDGVRYVVCYNPEEAEYDRKSREQMLLDLKDKLRNGPKGLIGNRGYRRYLKVQGEAVSIDEASIEQERRYDGKYVLRTNTELATAEVARAYKALWQVERAFRELKSGLDLRPVFHWSEPRIRGHIMVCFLAFVLEMTLCRHLKEAKSEVPYHEVLEALRAVQAVQVESDGERYLARTELTSSAQVAFKAVGLRPPNHIQAMPRSRVNPEREL